MPQLTGGVGQDEHGEPEDSQQLKMEREHRGKDGGDVQVRAEKTSENRDYESEWWCLGAHKDVEVGEVVVVIQDFFSQLLLYPAVHLWHTRLLVKESPKGQFIIHPQGGHIIQNGSDWPL